MAVGITFGINELLGACKFSNSPYIINQVICIPLFGCMTVLAKSSDVLNKNSLGCEVRPIRRSIVSGTCD